MAVGFASATGPMSEAHPGSAHIRRHVEMLAGTIGITLGLIAGYVGGAVDGLIMRIADVQLTFPAILIALLVNGDILSFEDAREALAQSGAAAVMIGRGAQGQPWLPGQIGRRLVDVLAGVQRRVVGRHRVLLEQLGLLGRDVGLEHPLVVPRGRDEVVDLGDGVLGAPLRTEPV